MAIMFDCETLFVSGQLRTFTQGNLSIALLTSINTAVSHITRVT